MGDGNGKGHFHCPSYNCSYYSYICLTSSTVCSFSRCTILLRPCLSPDDEVLLNLFKEMFSDEFDICTSSRLADARRMLKECAAHIIISDQAMPEIKGTMFLREVAEICPASYRILLTGAATMMKVVTEVSVRIVHLYMPKAFDEERMREALRRASMKG